MSVTTPPSRGATDHRHDVDWVVVGSGFGGSVAALRLAEKGYRVAVLERDNAIRFEARKRRLGHGYRLTTARDDERTAPTYIEAGHRVAEWLAERTGGIAQSSVFEALGNRPMTAHMLGGAVVGASPATGVVDEHLRVFGYQNMIICDAAALPANPGVNPALTITALAEHAMSSVAAARLGR